MTLWGTGPALWTAPGRSVDSHHTPPTGRGPTVDNPRTRWTTITGLTSEDEVSSTIHTPYYRHCQNLNSL